GEAEEELQVQGAMMVSKEPIASLLEHGGSCLMLELLFVAPRNRAKLNRDDEPFLQGAGTELLRWAAWFSRELGYEGRLRLDASPGSIGWYTRKRLRKVPAEPIVFEGVPYTPMELAPDAAQELLADWGGLEPTGGATCV
ncbi:MAG TPA: hypothetical protein VLJ39_09105, partial [Tepidisphaeraceae bacterium]|nr:hypothetical protein [Tepidisphaeraceae bacterium]